MKLVELAAGVLPSELVEIWNRAGINDLTDVQAKAFLHQPLVTGVKNAVIVGPTSSGKTFVGEALGLGRALKAERVAFLVPYKALAAEKYLALRDTYGEMFGAGIVVSSSDYSEFDPEIRRGNYSIAVLVYEKFAHLLLAHPGLLANLGLLVVDEIQMIRDSYRGARLELVLTKILQAERRPQILGLSATVRELNGLHEWLDADVIESAHRPVPLREAVCDLQGRLEYADGAGSWVREDLGFSRTCRDSDELVQRLVHHYYPRGKQMLIFRNTKEKTVQTARMLGAELEAAKVEPRVMEQLSLLDETDVRAYLEEGLARRVAYHNADLSAEERRLVEQQFRDGHLSVLVATTTLAAGVNLPADIVILPDLDRWNSTVRAYERISVSEYKNMAGRAGRLGQRTEGMSIALAAGGAYTKPTVIGGFIQNVVEAMESAIPKERDFPHLVLNLIASGLARTEAEVHKVLERSFAYHSFYVRRGGLGNVPAGAISNLRALGLVEERNSQLCVSGFGKVIASAGVSTETFAVFLEYLQSTDPGRLGFHELLYEICGVQEIIRMAPYPVRDERLGTKFIQQLPSPEEIASGTRLKRLMDSGYPPDEDRNRSLQKVVLIDAWRRGESARNLGRAFRVGLGAIRDLGETIAWLIEALEACAKVYGFPAEFRREMLDIAAEIHFGVPREAVKFARLRVPGVSRDQIGRLARNDKRLSFDSLDDFLDTPVENFAGVMNAAIVTRLKEAILQEAGDSLHRQHQAQLHRLEATGASSTLLRAAYTDAGVELERTLDSIFREPPLGWACARVTHQHKAEADLHVTYPDGLILIQITASEDGVKPIAWQKAREVLSAGIGQAPVAYVVVGRPDFHQLARQHADGLRGEAERRLLLVPLPLLMEGYVFVREGRTDGGRLLRVLREERGYLTRERLLVGLGISDT